MVVHEGAVPKTVIRIRTSTVIMAFVSQFLKWNCTVEKKQYTRCGFVFLLLVTSYIHFFKKKKNEANMFKRLTFTKCFSSSVVSFIALHYEQWLHHCWAKLWFNTGLCSKGKLKCHSISFHPSEVFRVTKYCPPPFSSLSLSSSPPRPASIPLCSSFSCTKCVCVFAFFIIFQLS